MVILIPLAAAGLARKRLTDIATGANEALVTGEFLPRERHGSTHRS